MIYFCNFIILFLILQHTYLASESFFTKQSRTQFPEKFFGSNLFGDGKFVKKCFSIEDVALLSARSKFEVLMPNVTMPTSNLETDKSVTEMLEYFYGSNELLSKLSKEDPQYMTQVAYYDVVGGYLHYSYLPFVKFSFYAGMLTYKSTLSVYSFHENCREMLNTNGNGWRQSTLKFLKMKCKIQPLTVHIDNTENSSTDDPCEHFLLASDDDYDDHELIVSLPRIEIEENENILNVWLPFKRKRNFVLNSKSSAFILTRYYVDVLKCYDYRKASNRFRFERRFQKLLHEKILPFINKEEFYPGFGAILRVWETLKRNVAVDRRATYDNQYDSDAYFMGSDSNSHMENQINNIQLEQSVNQTNGFLKVIDSMKQNESWNHEKKEKFIFLALIVSIVGLLLVCLWIFICRMRHMKTNNRLKESEERRNNLKNLLKNLKKPPDQKYRKDVVKTVPRSHLGSIVSSDAASIISENTSVTQFEINPKDTRSQLKNINTVNPGRKTQKFRQFSHNENNESNSSSSSTSSESTKLKKRSIYRKIHKELKQSEWNKSKKLRSISKASITRVRSSAEPHQKFGADVVMTGNLSLQKDKCWRQSAESEANISSSSWETLSSAKVKRIVK